MIKAKLRPVTALEEREILRLRRDEHLLIREIAARVGRPLSTVSLVFRRHGVRAASGRGARGLREKAVARLRQLFASGATVREVAAELGIARRTVLTWAQGAGVQLRIPRRAVKLPTRLPLLTRSSLPPTSNLPGPDKVAVLAARFAAGEPLWHPMDARRA